MTDDIKTKIIADISEMTSLAEQYGAATSEIISTDIDETLEEIVQRRTHIINSLAKVRTDITTLCSSCSPDESDLVGRMIRGANVPLGLSPDLREIHKAAVKMRSAYLSVTDKEKQAAARVDARVKELRIELQNVNADRKKTTGYTAAGSGLGGSGGSFDGRL